MKRPLTNQAFSLVEVTLAIGIVAFALLAVVALLPVGLQTVRNSNEQAGAAHVINSISNAILLARPTTAGSTTFVGDYGGGEGEIGVTFSYTLGGGRSISEWDQLTLSGYQETSGEPARLAARLVIDPPGINAAGTITNAGRATISVAWTAQANPEWNDSQRRWNNADGSLTTSLLFFPPP